MFKKISILIICIFVLASCTNATAKKETATYFESVDNQSSEFEVIKMVDKETGCKYMLVVSEYRATSIAQMMNKEGLPLCNK